MNEYNVGDFGEAHLIVEKKGCKRGITCTGTIQAIEKKFILFKDNDDYLYLAEKATFEFKHEKK
jgi:hypothetical protein